jgi:5-formyltetrahydrofolate cyclo-ligase
MESRQSLRARLRHTRQLLSSTQQASAAQHLLAHTLEADLLAGCTSLALYCPQDGEIDPILLAHTAWQNAIPVYLPVIDPLLTGVMRFHQWLPDTPMQANRFGIPEPQHTPEIAAQSLHTVMLPLVGFDAHGNRLGMGGGFYDRAFAFTLSANTTRLIGLAHECQKVPSLPCEAWDIPLEGVLTDQNYYQ